MYCLFAPMFIGNVQGNFLHPFFYLSRKSKSKRQWYVLVCQVLQLLANYTQTPKERGHVYPSPFLGWVNFELTRCSQMQWIHCLHLMEKKWKKDFATSADPLTLHSLKRWHHLEPDAPSTSCGMWPWMKWHFIRVLKTRCVLNQTDPEKKEEEL